MNRQYGALSGLAIALIVLNHAIHFGLQVAPVEGAWFKVLVVLQALGVFAVPVFLFVSGAFLAYAAREFTAAFISSSLQRILWPYAIWSSIYYALIYVASGEMYSTTGYLRNLLVGYPYHFVPLLVFWYATTPALVWAGRRRGVLLVAGIGVWQTWLLAVRYPEMFGLEGSLPGWAQATVPPVLFTSMSDWAIYFPMGLVMSLHATSLKPRLERWRPVAAATAIALFGLGFLNAFEVMSAPWARLAAPVPVMLLLPTISRDSLPWFGSLEWLGRRSYGLYLTHFVVLNALVLSLGRSTWQLADHGLVVYPAFFLAALGPSLILMEGLARTMPGRRAYRHLFGIVAPPVPQRRAT